MALSGCFLFPAVFSPRITVYSSEAVRREVNSHEAAYTRSNRLCAKGLMPLA